jgi:hypothetical protein
MALIFYSILASAKCIMEKLDFLYFFFKFQELCLRSLLLDKLFLLGMYGLECLDVVNN